MTVTETDDTISVDDFRARAREWLAANCERKSAAAVAAGGSLRGMHEFTKEQIDAERPKQKRLYEAGFAGITWPKEFGGQGLTGAHERAFIEESKSYELPNFGIAGGTTFGVCAQVILAHASDDFKARHLPRILAGDELWCQFFSEPVAGSDLAGVQTRATRDGDSWILNGAKVWSSWAHLADVGLCLTRTNWSVPKHRGMTWFCVPVDAPGVTLRVIRQINGGADFCEEFFDDVVIPDADRIGDVDDGWRVARTMLVFERGARAEEKPKGPVEPGSLATDLVDVARALDRADDPAARQLIAKAHSVDFLREVLGRRLATRLKLHGADAGIAAYGALAHGVFDAERALWSMELARGASVAWDADDPEGPGASTALTFLNGRINAIAGGTDQMQRNAIGEQVLGLPREPSWERDKPFEQVLREAQHWDGRV
jgi:alkylation response protein AidB-like acyl-CoA dehydrogenase